MDNFFAKKGIGVTKQKHQSSKPPQQQLLRSYDNIALNQMTQIQGGRQTTELQWGAPMHHSTIPFIPKPMDTVQTKQVQMNYVPKYGGQGYFAIHPQRREGGQGHVRRVSGHDGEKPAMYRADYANNIKDAATISVSTDIKTIDSYLNRGNQVDMGVKKEMRSLRDINYMKKEIKQCKPVSLMQIDTESRLNRESATSLLRAEVPEQVVTQEDKKQAQGIQKEREQPQVWEHRQLMKKQKQKPISRQGSKEKMGQRQSSNVEISEAKSTSAYWIEQKLRLIDEIGKKEAKIAQIQSRFAQKQREYQMKILVSESQKRNLQDAVNKLSIDNGNVRKLLQLQRAKNDKAQQRMDKMLFFEDDLIHAKDYSRLKREMEEVLTENAKMFQDHQKYIIEVTEMRRKYGDRIEELEAEIVKMREQIYQWRDKLENLGVNGDDKRMLIKLQHDVNFMLKKGEQNLKIMLQKEEDLQKAHLQIKKLNENVNQMEASKQNLLEGLNLQQLIETVARYENRLTYMDQVIETKNSELEISKRKVEMLTAELSQTKADRKITSMREKSNQNNLKNEVILLQQSLQSEVDLRCKKIKALQERLSLKTKECSDKDKFIKQFLLNRVKEIQKDSMEVIMDKIRRFFIAQGSPEDVVETAQSESVEIQSEDAIDI